jgi:hypothetical protein
MPPGVQQYITLCIIVNSRSVTVLGVAQGVTDIFRDGVQAGRQRFITAAQAAIFSRIARQGDAWQQAQRQKQST